jgi:hypothetical protein
VIKRSKLYINVHELCDPVFNFAKYALPINAVLKNLHDYMPIFWLAFGHLLLLLLAVVVVLVIVVVVVSLPS